ncbi:hypothetical protein AA0498_1058 [Acidomonas methanolica]|uniref:Uncharacterized protein n=1 Tax=Acidomonas methanolica NBRC 104435 TaxID=1231351 RepID=A0A023D960_ACIMT|nr:hypothetical protein Amme_124_006 [Acidomonas methanolica NBRC 104435]GBQ49742.1 hypothetical protein AA0498_1058 [Acidomonas methanolica]GEL00666.1 hypothetical protein AME01nite_31640 [Acidomonas methanolica NBRC 104435]
MKPDGPVHIMDDIGHANFHHCPGQADRSHEEPHWTVPEAITAVFPEAIVQACILIQGPP